MNVALGKTGLLIGKQNIVLGACPGECMIVCVYVCVGVCVCVCVCVFVDAGKWGISMPNIVFKDAHIHGFARWFISTSGFLDSPWLCIKNIFESVKNTWLDKIYWTFQWLCN